MALICVKGFKDISKKHINKDIEKEIEKKQYLFILCYCLIFGFVNLLVALLFMLG